VKPTGRRRTSPRQPVAAPSTAGQSRDVSIANRHPRLQLNRRAVIRVIAILDAHHAELATVHSTIANTAELSLAFLTDAELAQLHAQFLSDPTTTDVITFEGDLTLGIAGEICVSADTAASFARQHRREFASELTLYVVHGWLHLAGHDDLKPEKKRVMRRAEARAMKILQRAGAVPAFSFALPKAQKPPSQLIEKRASHCAFAE
jgi:probable rRNA maturation factor